MDQMMTIIIIMRMRMRRIERGAHNLRGEEAYLPSFHIGVPQEDHPHLPHPPPHPLNLEISLNHLTPPYLRRVKEVMGRGLMKKEEGSLIPSLEDSLHNMFIHY